MSIVASRPSESSRMSFNNAPQYRNVTPPQQPFPPYSRNTPPVSPRMPPSPSSPQFPSPYMNQFASASVPHIHSPTTVRYSYHPALKQGQFRQPQQHQHQHQQLQVFDKRLPNEVYECIVSHLQVLHLDACSEGCLTCYMRDLYSLSLTSRAWEKAVRGKLYNKIHIHGSDSPAQLKKYKWKRGSRLKLLRRTLRERKALANIVFELRIPELDGVLVTGKQNNVAQEYRDLLASVVMVCPNLERLLGITLPYNHEYDRLTHALSTRKNLREHSWIIGENAEAAERSTKQSTDLLDSGQVFQFLNYHTSWSKLETMMLHSMDSRGILEHGLFLRMLNFLPSLQHLSVSGFDANDFTDRTLLFLPPLVSLRLEGLQGVTENGLARYASRPEARGLKSLTLIDQNISSLLVISKLLASLVVLERFCIVQATVAPSLPQGGMVFQPILASATIKYLHWDLPSPNPAHALNQLDNLSIANSLKAVNTSNSHLAQSIIHAGFPALENLRAPLDIDPLGAIQAVCRPAKGGLVMVPADRYNLPRSSHGSLPKRPLAMPAGNNLSSARIRAQTLVDMAPKDVDTGMKVLVTDHSGDLIFPTLPSFPGNSEPEPDSGSDSDIEDIHNILGPLKGNAKIEKPHLPIPSPPSLKIHEFTIPSCMGRVYNAGISQKVPKPPRFALHPDTSCSDVDGGLMSWKHILAANQTSSFLQPSAPLLNHTNTNGNNSNNNSSTPIGRVNTNSSMGDDMCSSPSTTSSSRFSSMWGGSASSASTSNSSMRSGGGPRTPTSPTRHMWSSSNGGEQPFSVKHTCHGAWNQGHKLGKDWWSHLERERVPGSKFANPSNMNCVTPGQLFG